MAMPAFQENLTQMQLEPMKKLNSSFYILPKVSGVLTYAGWVPNDFYYGVNCSFKVP